VLVAHGRADAGVHGQGQVRPVRHAVSDAAHVLHSGSDQLVNSF
jgi:tRNA U38,U39,U40 pseudouridine synthase TruA